jgi:hypothetical protein
LIGVRAAGELRLLAEVSQATIPALVNAGSVDQAMHGVNDVYVVYAFTTLSLTVDFA